MTEPKFLDTLSSSCLVWSVLFSILFFFPFCSNPYISCREGLEFMLGKRQNVIKIEVLIKLHSIDIFNTPSRIYYISSLMWEHMTSTLLYFLGFKSSITLLWLSYLKYKLFRFNFFCSKSM